MKNRTFQRLFPLLRMGSILLAAVLFCAALIGVNAQLTVGTNEERNLATYLGLALTAVVTYLLQDVPKMLVGRHFGWKLVRYEASIRRTAQGRSGVFKPRRKVVCAISRICFRRRMPLGTT
mgnify:CR=1 FL=1